MYIFFDVPLGYIWKLRVAAPLLRLRVLHLATSALRQANASLMPANAQLTKEAWD